jgi:DNA-binding PadR family transcriptional regulator
MKKGGSRDHVTFFVKGVLDLFILTELERGPASGKELMEKIDFVTGENWKPSPGTTYPVLRKMEGEGLVKGGLSKDKGRRKINYSLTAKGRKEAGERRAKATSSAGTVLQVMIPLKMRMLYGFNDEEISGLHEAIRERLEKPRKKSDRKKAVKKLASAWRNLR